MKSIIILPLLFSFLSFFVVQNQKKIKSSEEISSQNSEQDFTISYFSKFRKVIPLYYKNGKLQVSNIKLPDLVIINNCNEKQKLEKIEVIGKNNDYELVKYTLQGDDCKALSSKINQHINLFKKSNELHRLKELFGEMYIPLNGFGNSNEIESGDSFLAPLSRLLFVNYIGKKKIDNILLILTFKNKNVNKKKNYTIDLINYETKSKYIFPIKGSINIVNLPTNFGQHRSSNYQEFALDIWDLRLDKNIGEYTNSKPNPIKLSDYYIYHREVIAPADGVVYEVGDKFPEKLMMDPTKFSAEYFQEIGNELVPKIGYENFIRGNYIIIDHGSSEYSFYGHLSEGSIVVNVGDTVKQGDVIAKVGNTGHSDAPHLHFHLMDSPNCFKANGLPLVFEDIPNATIGFDISEMNSLIHSDFLYHYNPSK